MRAAIRERHIDYLILCISPFLVFAVRAARPLHVAGLYQVLAVLQAVLVSVVAWRLGGWAIGVDAGASRRIALAGVLLVLPWVLFSFLAGVGLPQQATATENRLRYGVLLVDSIAMAAGLVICSEVLKEAGERFYSALGFAAIVFAGPLYACWAAFPLALGDVAAQERSTSGQVPSWLTSLQGLSEILLMSALFLTYLAAAAFGAALGRAQFLSRRSTRAFVGTSLFAVPCLAILMVVALRSPNDPMAVFKTWYAIPGFVFSIPAVSFMIPSLLGVNLLRRVGES